MSASRLKATLPVGILATLCALSAGDCSNEPVGPGDSVSIDAVYFESGMTVRDSVDARQVFELYVSHVESVAGTFRMVHPIGSIGARTKQAGRARTSGVSTS